MQTVFISELKPLLDAVAERMDLYVPKQAGSHYIYRGYDSSGGEVEFNVIRVCMPAKEFLFPLRELAAIFPEPLEPQDVKPFAVFGLKDCDIRSIEILDKVFTEEDFEDPFYVKRRQKMFIISSDCSSPGRSCFCNILGGRPFASEGFDLNLSPVNGGFVVEVGSAKGGDFVQANAPLFTEAGPDALAERERNRAEAQKQLEQINAELKLDAPVNEIVENSQDSEVYDAQARTCVECQACTRVCPTCHCFYLYDTRQKEYFAKLKMWDSCMRMTYAQVAGGGNPRKRLGERLRHRFMHKFSYFLERYGVDMCVGCGRCVDAEAGEVDIREVLKKLNEELKGKDKTKAKVAR
jgi:ferredoxin